MLAIERRTGNISMTMEIMNATALREAQQVIDAFEKTCNMTSEEMLLCVQGDIRLAQIDGFELMDWHYALEQRQALRFLVGTIHAVGSSRQNGGGFPYARTSHRELANSPEPELQLVA